MDQVQLIKILSDLEAKNVRSHPHTGHFQISCLLAEWTHERKEDTSPSCSISFKHEISLVHCFSAACGFGGTLVQYIDVLNHHKNGGVDGILDNVRYIERGDPAVKIDAVLQKHEQRFSRRRDIADKLEVWSDEELKAFKRVHKRSFLDRKKISVDIAREYSLLWEERSNRVVIPVRRFDGGLVGCVGRCWCAACQKDGDHPGRYFNYWAFGKEKFLFNECSLDKGKPIFVVEGIFDCLKMISIGLKNTVAIMGSSVSEEQAGKLKASGQPVYMMFDGDAAGRKCTLRATKALKGKVVALYECVMPEGKDPGDLGAEAIKDIVSSAKLLI